MFLSTTENNLSLYEVFRILNLNAERSAKLCRIILRYGTHTRGASKTATNQNGHRPKRPHDYGEHVNQYLSLNKLGIIKSRSETMPEVGFKQNALY